MSPRHCLALPTDLLMIGSSAFSYLEVHGYFPHPQPGLGSENRAATTVLGCKYFEPPGTGVAGVTPACFLRPVDKVARRAYLGNLPLLPCEIMPSVRLPSFMPISCDRQHLRRCQSKPFGRLVQHAQQGSVIPEEALRAAQGG